MNKLLLTAVVVIFFNIHALAQVVGISNSKLNVYTAYTIDFRTLEVEPSFSWMSSRSAFDAQGRRLFYSPGKDSLQVSGDVYLRGTLSPMKNLEIGTFITSNLSSVSLGMKYLFWQNTQSALAFISGVNWSGKYKAIWSYHAGPGPEARITAYACGLVYSHQISDRFSWDTDIQYQKTISGGRSYLDDSFVNSELGYYIMKQLQLAGGFGYHSSYNKIEGSNAYSFTFYPGMTIETGKSYVIILYGAFDLFGENTEVNRGINLSITLTFD
ncbi:MAG: hypothetical protein JXR71_10920 [Bacteroidales bacterium]|nr:hypothetical protein [Bacteroidales bacterium]